GAWGPPKRGTPNGEATVPFGVPPLSGPPSPCCGSSFPFSLAKLKFDDDGSSGNSPAGIQKTDFRRAVPALAAAKQTNKFSIGCRQRTDKNTQLAIRSENFEGSLHAKEIARLHLKP